MAKKSVLLLASSILMIGACSPAVSSSSGGGNSGGGGHTDVSWSGSGSTNDEAYDYESIYVNTPTNAVADDFAYGVDLSIVKEIEDLGGKYYDKDGNEADVFQVLADGGSNYVRLRLWNDPYDADGNPYGGGTNDLATDIYLAKRAENAGMKVLIDFHLSDSWCDPGKQYRPKAWSNLSVYEDPTNPDAETLFTAVEDFVRDSLQSFKDAGVTVSSFQVGNETNNQILGQSTLNHAVTSEIYKSGIEGGKAVFPEAKSIIHLTNIRSNAAVKEYLDNLESDEVPYDIAGFSYYPYWHGTKDNLLDILTYAANKGKEAMVMETSWGFTDEQNEVVSNQYSSTGFGNAGGYGTSYQAQATELADIVNVLSQVPNQKGTGIFYWEPAWLPTPGTGWITRAGYFYNEYGRDPSTDAEKAIRDGYSDNSLKASWSNQALFSYTGKVLPSAYTYKYLKEGTKTIEEKVTGLVSDNLTHTINLKDESTMTLPTTVKVKTNLDAYRDETVTWNQSQYDAMIAAKDGKYTIEGTTSGGLAVTCAVTVETNFVLDPSFENTPGSGEELEVAEPWTATCSPDGAAQVHAKNEGNRTGTKYFHWYHSQAFTFDISQVVEVDQSGSFALRTYVMGNMSDGYNSFDIYYKINDGEEVVTDAKYALQGWIADLQTGMKLIEVTGLELVSGDKVTIGLRCDALAESWGHNDDWSLVLNTGGDEPIEEEYGILNPSFENDYNLSTSSSPWVLGEGSTGVSIKSNNEIVVKDDAGTAINGSNYLGWWADSAFSFSVSQTFKVEEAGDYVFATYFISEVYDTAYNSASITFVAGNRSFVTELEEYLTGWSETPTRVTNSVVVPEGVTDVTVTLEMDCKANGWGQNDLWSFEKAAA